MAVKQLKITLLKSSLGRLKNHKACLAGLGLRRINQTVLRENTPAIRGMVNKVSYLVHCEEV